LTPSVVSADRTQVVFPTASVILRIAAGLDATYIHGIDSPRVVLAEDHARIAEQLPKLLEPEFGAKVRVSGWPALRFSEDR